MTALTARPTPTAPTASARCGRAFKAHLTNETRLLLRERSSSVRCCRWPR